MLSARRGIAVLFGHVRDTYVGYYMVGLHRWLAVGKCLRVSSRLPSHKHLHELIRQRLAYQASHLAEQMMSSGMKVRTRSLEVLFTALAQTTSPSVQEPSSEAFSSVLPKGSVSRSLDIHPGLISDTSTRFAVRLLLLARQSRQRRTHRMFKTLMALCLINGEIIIASLLFGVLVRDWQKRVQLGQQKEDEEDIDGQFDSPKKAVRKSTAIYNTPFPAWSHLKYMCEYIDESISACPPASSPDTDPEGLVRYTASLQALANLAQLLDHRILPIGGLAGLLQTMYKCPSGDVKVWVWEKKKKKGEGTEDDEELEAHAYFKNVLRRLAERLPRITPSSNSASSLRESAPAPLTLQTYNTLLHYSLVHARARWMADKILHHMLYVHKGIEPSVVTMNILENAAMRSRDKGINKQWVEGWKKRVNECSRSQVVSSDDRKRGTNEISSLTLELLDIAARYAQNPAELVKVNNDNYTLSTRITYLIAHGRPDVVVDALPALLPGISPLRISFHNRTLNSTRTPTTEEESAAQYDLAIHRAVAYGPVLLTSLLTALMKTGRTGLAEKVWKVMKKAEHLSWELYSQLPGKEAKILSPWCLGVEAYTVMIKVYGKEARKGAGYGHNYSRLDRGADTGKHMVVGWGRELQSGNNKKRRGRRKNITRVQLGRHMGMRIYRTALKEEAILRFKYDRLCSKLDKDECLRMRVVKGQFRVPRPDAQFFNAILDIVARRPGMTPRSRASWTRRKAKSRLMAKRKKYAWEGKVMGLTEPDGRLKEVVRDIRRFGFQVPLLMRRILVGRDDDIEGHERGDEGAVCLKIATGPRTR